MWTDGRYYLQAEKQLEKGWVLQKMEAGVPPYYDWVATNLPKGSKVGVDPEQIPASKTNLI
jgi:Xaa-Pro aminopeptidase